jgi:CDP-6-deoxy-D-xylo-4-hexulose-3-dehydrase
MSDLHGAIGLAQMDKLPAFIESRKRNHRYLWQQFVNAGLDSYFILPPNNEVSWFGFVLICKPTIKRNEITRWLEGQGIQTRIVFGGNVLRHEAYKNANIRKAAALANTDIVHYDAFWVGCWPGLTREQLDYIVDKVGEYCKIAEVACAD